MARRYLLLLAVASTLAIGGCLTDMNPGDGERDDPAAAVADDLEGDDHLEIHHLDVGQADATLVIEPGGETMLIDTGDWRDDGETVIAALEARGIDRIDHLVTTHGHADHVGGHAAVIERFETRGEGVGAVYDSGVAHTTGTYEAYLDAVEAHDVTLYEVRAGDSLSFGEAAVTFLNPPADGPGTDLDANSVALTITYGDATYLTTGDADVDAETRMIDDHGDALDADVYQAGHHGSSTSSSAPFLDAVDPAIAVISSARDSQYGHPHDEVLERFAERDVETYWTGVHGDVVVATDGEAIAVATEFEGPTDAAALLEAKPNAASAASPSRVDARPDGRSVRLGPRHGEAPIGVGDRAFQHAGASTIIP